MQRDLLVAVEHDAFGRRRYALRTGWAAWHMLQRDITISATCLNCGGGGSALMSIFDPTADSHAMAAMPAAAMPTSTMGCLCLRGAN